MLARSFRALLDEFLREHSDSSLDVNASIAKYLNLMIGPAPESDDALNFWASTLNNDLEQRFSLFNGNIHLI